jgi:hypothetical protein
LGVFYRQRFRPEFKRAFEGWLVTKQRRRRERYGFVESSFVYSGFRLWLLNEGVINDEKSN